MLPPRHPDHLTLFVLPSAIEGAAKPATSGRWRERWQELRERQADALVALARKAAAARQPSLAYELVNVLFEGFIPSFIHFHSESEFLAMIERAGLHLEWLVRRQAWEFDREQDLHDNWANILKQRGLAPQAHPFQEAIPLVLIISARQAN